MTMCFQLILASSSIVQIQLRIYDYLPVINRYFAIGDLITAVTVYHHDNRYRQPPSLDRSYFHVLQSMHSSVIVYTLVCCAW